MANFKESQSYSSRSIENLDKMIIACTDNQERHILFAKKASQLARFSFRSEALALAAKLRKVNSNYEPRLSAWINFIEGLLEHFETLNNSRSKDKFNRALLIGQMAGDREISGMAAAWVAHCELVAGNISSVAKNITIAFEWSDEHSAETRGRASMVLADALSWAGSSDVARYWYREARKHAVREGDISMQNVMLFNAASFAVANLTLQDCVETLGSESLKRTAMEVASAKNLNSALGIESLPSLIPIMQAELLVLQKKWQAALELFDENIPRLVIEGQKRLIPKLLVQSAWCSANLGCHLSATEKIQESINKITDCTDFDDLSILHYRISLIGNLMKDNHMEYNHKSQGSKFLQQFREQQIDMMNVLGDVIKVVAQIRNPA
jgi:hypothetical protein